MFINKSEFRYWSMTAILFAFMATKCLAEDFPTKPITLVVSYTIGGQSDTLARLLAKQMEDNLKVPIVIDNKGGAGGLVAAAFVGQSKPDGYTLVYMAGSGYTISPSVLPKMKIDMHKILTPIAYTTKQKLVLVVNPKLPIKTVSELVLYAKANPEKMNFGSPGAGTLPHLMVEQLKNKLGFNAMHVPYKGGADMQRALMAGDIQLIIDSVATTFPNIVAGRMRPIAIADQKRVSVLPEVPTFPEQGVDMTTNAWGAILAPIGTPTAIVNRIHSAVVVALQDPVLSNKLATMSVEPYAGTPQELKAGAEKEIVIWGELVKELGLVEK